MITDEIVSAIELMIETCTNTEQKNGMEKLLNMLMDLNLNEWENKINDDKKRFVSLYL